jgi:hypothetical protein
MGMPRLKAVQRTSCSFVVIVDIAHFVILRVEDVTGLIWFVFDGENS